MLRRRLSWQGRGSRKAKDPALVGCAKLRWGRGKHDQHSEGGRQAVQSSPAQPGPAVRCVELSCVALRCSARLRLATARLELATAIRRSRPSPPTLPGCSLSHSLVRSPRLVAPVLFQTSALPCRAFPPTFLSRTLLPAVSLPTPGTGDYRVYLEEDIKTTNIWSCSVSSAVWACN